MLTAQKIMQGKTVHWRRTDEAEHRFTYPVLYFSLPITQKIKTTKLFKHNKFGLYGFLDADHGSTADTEKDEKLLNWFHRLVDSSVQAEELQKQIVHIELISQPRVLGFVFNPVSFWLCYDIHNTLICALAEVNNTFGTRYSYLLTLDTVGEITKSESLMTSKRLYVSPFFKITGSYEFKFNLKDQKTNIGINYYRDITSEEFALLSKLERKKMTPSLMTTLSLEHKTFNDKNLLKAFGKYGFSTLLVVIRIHWQAVKLKIKGAKFFNTKDHIATNDSSNKKRFKNLAIQIRKNTLKSKQPLTDIKSERKENQEMHHETSRIN